MKKFLSLLMLTVMIMVCYTTPFLTASAETVTRDFLYEQSARGNSAPTRQTSLPYTASWNSVTTYTYTNYYFTGYSRINVTLDVAMNYTGSEGRFYVYLCNKTTGGRTCIIDSGSAMFSYEKSTSVSLNSSNSYYLEFRKTGSRSCWGDIYISA